MRADRRAQDRLARTGLPLAAYVLAALLGASALLLLFGREDARPFPSIESTRPSGLRAFSELLRKNGYDPVFDGSERPRLISTDLVVTAKSEAVQPQAFEPSARMESPLQAKIREHAQAGGARVQLRFGTDFDQETLEVRARPVTSPFAPKSPALRVAFAPHEGGEVISASGETLESYVPLLVDDQGRPWAYLDVREGPRIASLPSGIAASNRFIDRDDHADALMRLVRALQPKPGRVVFAEASFGNVREPSLASELGPWMVSLQWQGALLLVVIAFSLGKRFGLPDAASLRETGAREMVDAFGALMRRAKRPDLALKILAERVEARARVALKVPRNKPLRELNPPPVALLEALAVARESSHRWSLREAASVAARLQAAVEQLEHGLGPRG